MNSQYLLGQIQSDMNSMNTNACLECKAGEVCDSIGGETMCGILRQCYN